LLKIVMKFYKSALLALLAVAPSVAFLPPVHQQCSVPRGAAVGLAASSENSETKVDISVPYDAAARLAYEGWRKEFKKGDFDEKRYLIFQKNYVDISIANVMSKKQAREQGVDNPDLLNLNEFGDYTAEEYAQQQSGGGTEAKASTTTVDAEVKAPADAEAKAPTMTAGAEAEAEATSTPLDLLSKAMEAAQSQSAASEALGDAYSAMDEEEEVGHALHYR
jgi:hypothetical protein